MKNYFFISILGVDEEIKKDAVAHTKKEVEKYFAKHGFFVVYIRLPDPMKAIKDDNFCPLSDAIDHVAAATDLVMQQKYLYRDFPECGGIPVVIAENFVPQEHVLKHYYDCYKKHGWAETVKKVENALFKGVRPDKTFVFVEGHAEAERKNRKEENDFYEGLTYKYPNIYEMVQTWHFEKTDVVNVIGKPFDYIISQTTT